MRWRHFGATFERMPSVQIKHVPEDVHRTLRARAAQNGQSLQEYLLALLVEEARHEPLNTVLDRLDRMTGGTLTADFALEVLRDERDRR
jgi:hypothetical protein